MDFLTFFNGILEAMVNSFLDSNSFMGAARLVAGVGAIIGVGSTFMKIVSFQADSSDAWKYMFKILIVSLAITFYPTVIKTINIPLNLIGESAKAVAENNINESSNYYRSFSSPNEYKPPENQKYKEKLDGYLAESSTSNPEVEANGGGQESETVSSSTLTSLIMNGGEAINGWFMEAIMSILNFLGKMALTVLNAIRTFLLIVLGIFGIFAISFSIYPTMESSFSTWLKKYINVYLWLPIGYVMMGVVNKLYQYVIVHPQSGADIAETAGTSLLGLMVSATAIVGTFVIPTMAGWMVNTSTANMGSKITSKAKKGSELAKKGIKGVKAMATSGASVAKDAAKSGATAGSKSSKK